MTEIRQLLSVATAGLVAGLVAVSLAISYATLIFRGELEGSAPVGVGLAFFGGLIIGLTVALKSGFRSNIAGPQDAPAAIIALGAVAIGGAVAADSAEDTVIAFIILTTAATGVFLFILGHFRIGGLVRYLPFPVVGGFLGGTGVILVESAVDIVLGDEGFRRLFSGDVAPRSIPAIGLGLALIIAYRRHRSPHFALPVLIISATAIFHLVIRARGISSAEALDRDWLLGPFEEGSLWRPDAIASLGRADWGAVAGQAAALAAVMAVSAISLLLNTTGLENELDVDIDADHELRVTGLANILASIGGGLPGYVQLADSTLVGLITRPHRAVGVVSALVVGVAMVLGAELVSIMPVAVSAGILLFVGGSFVVEWVYESRSRLTRTDHLLVLLIIGAITFVGFLPGLGIGLIVAVTIFVVRYSRIDVVRHQTSTRRRTSNVVRSPAETSVLESHGDQVAILELQGFLFFGTADRILAAVQARVDDSPPVRDVVLDLRRVTGIDSSAAASLTKIVRLGRARGFELSIADPMGHMSTGFDSLVARPHVSVVADLDRALQGVEDRLIEDVLGAADGVDDCFAGLIEALGPTSALVDYLTAIDPMDLAGGTELLTRGEPSPGLFLLEDGQVSVQTTNNSNGIGSRQRSMGAGTLVGEMAWYLDGLCSATVSADGPCRVRHLDTESLEALGVDRPEILAELHLFVARTLAERLRHANDAIDHLLR